jgi:hypothetical protein
MTMNVILCCALRVVSTVFMLPMKNFFSADPADIRRFNISLSVFISVIYGRQLQTIYFTVDGFIDFTSITQLVIIRVIYYYT